MAAMAATAKKKRRWDCWTSPATKGRGTPTKRAAAGSARTPAAAKAARLARTPKTPETPGSTSSSSSRSNSAPTARTKTKIKTRDGGEQVFLDFGQRCFEQTTCKRCGMMYAPGVRSDEAEHRAFCKRAGGDGSELGAAMAATATLPARAIRDEWVVARLGEGKERIVMLPRGAMATKSSLVRNVHEFKRCVVDPVMGFADAVEGWADSPLRYNLIYTVGSEIAGLLTLERLREDQHVWDADTCGARKPLLGVVQIWSSPRFRRRGVARKLLDAGRAHCIYGFVVPRDGLAFSQPTSEGRALASAYTGVPASRVVVYSFMPASPGATADGDHSDMLAQTEQDS